MRIRPDQPSLDLPDLHLVPCPRCDGRRMVVVEARGWRQETLCWVCKGSGRIDTRSPIGMASATPPTRKGRR